MPEGHIVHAEARRFTDAMGGHVVRATSPQGRFADGALALDGHSLLAAHAHGKHLFLQFSGSDGSSGGSSRRSGPAGGSSDDLSAGPWLHVHLGLIGSWSWRSAASGVADTQGVADAGVRLRLSVPAGATADLRGAMTCALVDELRVEQVLATLGPDPIRCPAPPQAAWERVSRTVKPVGTLLLDQSVVAGAGLIWRCEAPYLAGISPYRPGRDLSHDTWSTLWHELSRIMRDAVAWDRPAGAPGPVDGHTLSDTFHVFRRDGQPCSRCHTPIEVATLNTRKVWWCPHCQPH